MSAFTDAATNKRTAGNPCGVTLILDQLATTDPESRDDLAAALALPKTQLDSEEIGRRVRHLAELNLITKGIAGTTIARHRRHSCGCGK